MNNFMLPVISELCVPLLGQVVFTLLVFRSAWLAVVVAFWCCAPGPGKLIMAVYAARGPPISGSWHGHALPLVGPGTDC